MKAKVSTGSYSHGGRLSAQGTSVLRDHNQRGILTICCFHRDTSTLPSYYAGMSQRSEPCRLGVVVIPTPKMNLPALQFLILAMNKEQSLFQFEFYNFYPTTTPLLKMLGSENVVARAEAKQHMPDFASWARDRIDCINTQ